MKGLDALPDVVLLPSIKKVQIEGFKKSLALYSIKNKYWSYIGTKVRKGNFLWLFLAHISRIYKIMKTVT